MKVAQQQIAEMTPGDFIPIVALKAGAFAKQDGVYHIKSTLELAAIESWMGDIDFVGSIQVQDSIEAGLVVRAAETIHVGNRIENSMADAKQVII